MSSGATPSYRLGVDVGGTFTDLLLINEATGETHSAKVPSTPADSSVGVLNGIAKICEQNGVKPEWIGHVMHGTTVATNTVLEGKGARVGLVTTEGYRNVLQIARSFVPGGLGGWVTYNKRALMAPLELTIEAIERLDARGEVVKPLDEVALATALRTLKEKQIEALTVCLVHAYANGGHEVRVREIAEQVLPGVPVSISSEVIPEMYEYERAETTVVNSYIRPVVSRYIENLHRELKAKMKDVALHVLRSDGGLSSVQAARHNPVNLLMSGPAGGVAGAQWIARQSGFRNLLTFDMGGTSTDVALIENEVAQTPPRDARGRRHRARAVDRRAHRGSRRRLDRLRARAHQGAARRAAERRRLPGAGRLHEGWRAAHGDRRQRRARLPAHLVAPGRRHEDRPHPGRSRDAARRDAAGQVGQGGPPRA